MCEEAGKAPQPVPQAEERLRGDSRGVVKRGKTNCPHESSCPQMKGTMVDNCAV